MSATDNVDKSSASGKGASAGNKIKYESLFKMCINLYQLNGLELLFCIIEGHSLRCTASARTSGAARWTSSTLQRAPEADTQRPREEDTRRRKGLTRWKAAQAQARYRELLRIGCRRLCRRGKGVCKMAVRRLQLLQDTALLLRTRNRRPRTLVRLRRTPREVPL